MPQLDFQTFFVQFLWYFILFSVNLYLLYFFITPAFCRINLMRWKIYNYFINDIQFLNFQAEVYFSHNTKILIHSMHSVVELVNQQLTEQIDSILVKANQVLLGKRTDHAKYNDILSISVTGFVFSENEDLVNFTFLFSFSITIFLSLVFWIFFKEKLKVMLFSIFFLPYTTKVLGLVELANTLFDSFLANIQQIDTLSGDSWATCVMKYNYIIVQQPYLSFLSFVTYLYKYNNKGGAFANIQSDYYLKEKVEYDATPAMCLYSMLETKDDFFLGFFLTSGEKSYEVACINGDFTNLDSLISLVDNNYSSLKSFTVYYNFINLTDVMQIETFFNLTNYDRENLLALRLITGSNLNLQNLKFLNYVNYSDLDIAEKILFGVINFQFKFFFKPFNLEQYIPNYFIEDEYIEDEFDVITPVYDENLNVSLFEIEILNSSLEYND